MSNNKELLTFVHRYVYPEILHKLNIYKYRDEISILLVGSTATGLHNEFSDLDLCILCDQSIYRKISLELKSVAIAINSEIIIKERPVQYYIESISNVKKKLNKMDDLTFYIYGTAIPIKDHSGLLKKLSDIISDENTKQKRNINALNNLNRQIDLLNEVILKAEDPILRINTGIKTIQFLLKVIALKDSLQFDDRKRLYTMALAGHTGSILRPLIDKLLSYISELSYFQNTKIADDFLKIINDCIYYF